MEKPGIPEYQERSLKFLSEIERQIFSKLTEEGFFCSGSSMADIRAETLHDEDLPVGLDQPDPDLQVLVEHRRVTGELDAESKAKREDHAEILITGPSGKRAVLELTREEFLKIAKNFGGQERVWTLLERPSMQARMQAAGAEIDVPPGKETELALLASYLFQG